MEHVYNIEKRKLFLYKARFNAATLTFFHSSSEKLFLFLRRSDRPNATPEAHRLLREITKACENFQKFSAFPYRFRVSMSKEKLCSILNLTTKLQWTYCDCPVNQFYTLCDCVHPYTLQKCDMCEIKIRA